ncbi:hypothetical protein OESDEN_01556 [Oesophagostomum dentatum]|uniref:SCP domain-containing protein n=1 Tax=Oesophagostomum dentatum TaxID=61180 RepID=A0A0B1TRJ4_OESDE|nr:hypothetical protein OESDEN_01556 [Oesophagostomum dentatum]
MCPDNGDNGMTDDLRNVYLARHNSLRSTLAMGAAYNGNNGTLLRRANKMPMLVG